MTEPNQQPDNLGEFEALDEAEQAQLDAAERLADTADDFDPDEAPAQTGEVIASDDPERAARSLVATVMGVLNWLLKLKEPRAAWTDETIERAQTEIAPALVKHGVGASGPSKYGEEVRAVSFLGMLGWDTRAAIIELRELDEAEAKARADRTRPTEAGASHG